MSKTHRRQSMERMAGTLPLESYLDCVSKSYTNWTDMVRKHMTKMTHDYFGKLFDRSVASQPEKKGTTEGTYASFQRYCLAVREWSKEMSSKAYVESRDKFQERYSVSLDQAVDSMVWSTLTLMSMNKETSGKNITYDSIDVEAFVHMCYKLVASEVAFSRVVLFDKRVDPVKRMKYYTRASSLIEDVIKSAILTIVPLDIFDRPPNQEYNVGRRSSPIKNLVMTTTTVLPPKKKKAIPPPVNNTSPLVLNLEQPSAAPPPSRKSTDRRRAQAEAPRESPSGSSRPRRKPASRSSEIKKELLEALTRSLIEQDKPRQQVRAMVEPTPTSPASFVSRTPSSRKDIERAKEQIEEKRPSTPVEKPFPVPENPFPVPEEPQPYETAERADVEAPSCEPKKSESISSVGINREIPQHSEDAATAPKLKSDNSDKTDSEDEEGSDEQDEEDEEDGDDDEEEEEESD